VYVRSDVVHAGDAGCVVDDGEGNVGGSGGAVGTVAAEAVTVGGAVTPPVVVDVEVGGGAVVAVSEGVPRSGR
jgi:hypothetical protein